MLMAKRWAIRKLYRAQVRRKEGTEPPERVPLPLFSFRTIHRRDAEAAEKNSKCRPMGKGGETCRLVTRASSPCLELLNERLRRFSNPQSLLYSSAFSASLR